jgi:hypothetical protein
MKINKLFARQVKEASLIKEKRTRRRIIKWFIPITVSILIFDLVYIYWHEIKNSMCAVTFVQEIIYFAD